MRKPPSQERSKHLVDCLVETATTIIAEEGLEAATTSRIAERSGVSVGSLYQYFSNKQEIHQAVLDSLHRDQEVAVDEAVASVTEPDVKKLIRVIIEKSMEHLLANNERYLKVLRYWPQFEGQGFTGIMEQKLTNILAVYAFKGAFKTDDSLPVKTFIVINSVMFTLIHYISSPPSNISRQELLDNLILLTEHMLTDSSTTQTNNT